MYACIVLSASSARLKNVSDEIRLKSILDPNQSCFRPCDSMINQLLSITHVMFKAFDCNPPLDVRSVVLDISKAFDRVKHDSLINLNNVAFQDNFLLLLEGFLGIEDCELF